MDKLKCYEDMDEESLTLIDVTCPICLSIMIQPVTMPCFHSLCYPCFELNVSKSNIACPLCRKRISIWVRKMTKCKKLTNEVLWEKIQNKFQNEVDARLNGKDDENNSFTCTHPPIKVAAPGEIREEFEEQVRRLQEEQEAVRKKEEAASVSIIQALQENEEKEFSGFIQEREQLAEKDFEFAKQLRSSQITETLTTIIKSNKKKIKESIINNSKKGIAGTSSTPSAAPIDFYLEHLTPETRENLTPITPPQSDPKEKIDINENYDTPGSELRFRNIDRELSGDTKSSLFQSITSTPTNEASTSTSSRLFKDITYQYSSESDSEENIAVIENFKSKGFGKAKKKCQFRDDDNTPKSPEKSNLVSPTKREDEVDVDPLSFLSEVFDENNQSTNECISKLIEEQKLLEKKIEQEKEDRRLALHLQKTWKQVDRSKGSKDEYSLRNHTQSAKKPSSGKFQQSKRTPDNSKQNKLRQATLLESLSKKQRRV